MPNDNQSQPATIQNHRKLAELVVHVIKTKSYLIIVEKLEFGIKLKTMKHLRKVYDPDPKHSQQTEKIDISTVIPPIGFGLNVSILLLPC